MAIFNDVEKLVENFNKPIDFSYYNTDEVTKLVDFSSSIEKLVHGAVWESPWFRKAFSQEPYSVNFKTLYGDRKTRIYNVALSEFDPVILKNSEEILYIPPGYKRDEPWKKDYLASYTKLLLFLLND
ncbi:MAG: hypothetical protein ACQESF_04470 [Nanobdellota archaeon]